MASERQIAANRQNAKKSTGPKTDAGKQRSRQNAFRHGLTAQTVIWLVEDADQYTDLEALIIADYEPQTTIERVLVERLASLLWRLRRAVAIETGLFQAQGPNLRRERESRSYDTNNACEMTIDPIQVFRNLLGQNKPVRAERKSPVHKLPNQDPPVQDPPHCAPSNSTQTQENIATASINNPTGDTPRCTALSHRFLRLASTECGVLERIERYEVSLWRQVAQTVLMLNSMQAGLKFYGRSSFRKYPAAWK